MWNDTCWMSFFFFFSCRRFDKLWWCFLFLAELSGKTPQGTLLAREVSTVLLKQHDWSWSEDTVKAALGKQQSHSSLTRLESTATSWQTQWMQRKQRKTSAIKQWFIWIITFRAMPLSVVSLLHKANQCKVWGPWNYRIQVSSICHCLGTPALLAEIQAVNSSKEPLLPNYWHGFKDKCLLADADWQPTRVINFTRLQWLARDWNRGWRIIIVPRIMACYS